MVNAAIQVALIHSYFCPKRPETTFLVSIVKEITKRLKDKEKWRYSQSFLLKLFYLTCVMQKSACVINWEGGHPTSIHISKCCNKWVKGSFIFSDHLLWRHYFSSWPGRTPNNTGSITSLLFWEAEGISSDLQKAEAKTQPLLFTSWLSWDTHHCRHCWNPCKVSQFLISNSIQYAASTSMEEITFSVISATRKWAQCHKKC